MPHRLPTIQVTPVMAMHFARKHHFSATAAHATGWLIRNKIEIERRLLEATQSAIEDVLFDITLWEWPDPEANKLQQQIEGAIFDAIAKHEEAFKVELMCETVKEEKMQKIVRSFLHYKGTKAKKTFLVVYLSFRKTGLASQCRLLRSSVPSRAHVLQKKCERGPRGTNGLRQSRLGCFANRFGAPLHRSAHMRHIKAPKHCKGVTSSAVRQ